MDKSQRSSQLNHNPPQANACDNQCQQYRELQQLRQYYHEAEDLDEFEEELNQQQHGEYPDEQQYQNQQSEEQRQHGQQEEEPFDQWNHQQIQGQQQLRQMPLEAERCVQDFPLLPFNRNPVLVNSQGNGSNVLAQNMEAHRYSPQHAALYVNPPKRNTINPTAREIPFNQPLRRDDLALNHLSDNKIGSSSSAFLQVQQTQYQTRNAPLVTHNRQLGIVDLGIHSHELSPAEYYASGRRLPISSVRTSQHSDIGNRNMPLQNMHAQSMRSGGIPSSSFVDPTQTQPLPTTATSYSKRVPCSTQKEAEAVSIPTDQLKIRRPIAQRFSIVPHNTNPGQNMMTTRFDIPTPQPLDFSLKRQNLANKQNSLTKRQYGEVRANEAVPHLSRNKRVRWRDEPNKVASFSSVAQMDQRANQHQQFTPPRNVDVIRVGEVEQQQNVHNNGGVGNRNFKAGLNVPISRPHQQPGPSYQVGKVNMVQRLSKERTDWARVDLPKNNEILNTEEQSKVKSPTAVPHQMKTSKASQTPKGLTFQTIDGGYSDLLLTKLEGNYMNSRNLVFLNKENCLMTPLKFLRYLCQNMETGMHLESFRFWLGPKIGLQCRTEIFAGRFCGVAHSKHNVLSKDLAAANVLERMWNYFEIQGFDSKYAVFLGKRFCKVDSKLKKLCHIHNLGLVDKKVDDLKYADYSITQGPRFRCICKVKNEQTVVLIDNKVCGEQLAAVEMYKHLTDPMKGNLPPLVDVEIQDYFAVGAECPTLTQIFSERGLIPNPPEGNKLEWMLENFVTDADIDSCLHDPSNSTSYLDNNGIWVNANDKLEYKIRLEEAAKMTSPGMRTYPDIKHPM